MLDGLTGIILTLKMGKSRLKAVPYEVIMALTGVQVVDNAKERDGFQLSFTLGKRQVKDYNLLQSGLFDPDTKVSIVLNIKGRPVEPLMSGVVKNIQLGSSNEPGMSSLTVMGEGIRGVNEETTTGVHRLYQLAAAGELLFPAINVNDSVTKSKFDNKYGCRHSLVDGINRAVDVLIAGKLALVCGYGDVGKGCAEALQGQGARVVVAEVDPICALQAMMNGFTVDTLDNLVDRADVIITATGNKNIVTVEHMARMKHQTILGNIGHFDNEIDMAGLERRSGARRLVIKPQVDEWTFPDGHSIIVLSEGRLLNLGNATGHPSFVMSNSFSNQVIAQVELFTKHQEYDREVYTLPKALDEKVARIHVEALGGQLTKLTKEQAEYINVDVEGPYKPPQYRY